MIVENRVVNACCVTAQGYDVVYLAFFQLLHILFGVKAFIAYCRGRSVSELVKACQE